LMHLSGHPVQARHLSLPTKKLDEKARQGQTL
jgi:hypothetical protein